MDQDDSFGRSAARLDKEIIGRFCEQAIRAVDISDGTASRTVTSGSLTPCRQ
jgi:hypothetical protein